MKKFEPVVEEKTFEISLDDAKDIFRGAVDFNDEMKDMDCRVVYVMGTPPSQGYDYRDQGYNSQEVLKIKLVFTKKNEINS